MKIRVKWGCELFMFYWLEIIELVFYKLMMLFIIVRDILYVMYCKDMDFFFNFKL